MEKRMVKTPNLDEMEISSYDQFILLIREHVKYHKTRIYKRRTVSFSAIEKHGKIQKIFR